MPTTKYICPHCNFQIKGEKLEMWEIAFQAGFDAYECPNCGQTITKEEFESSYKKDEKQPKKSGGVLRSRPGDL
ncbi:MAG: hypothetical protein HY863_18505 [Chloroflexi bacterium]|nr:hypothetical protein [Chloroflexota bacterium]